MCAQPCKGLTRPKEQCVFWGRRPGFQLTLHRQAWCFRVCFNSSHLLKMHMATLTNETLCYPGICFQAIASVSQEDQLKWSIKYCSRFNPGQSGSLLKNPGPGLERDGTAAPSVYVPLWSAHTHTWTHAHTYVYRGHSAHMYRQHTHWAHTEHTAHMDAH